MRHQDGARCARLVNQDPEREFRRFKAMISKIENAQTSPTSSILGKLSGAFGLPLSTLLHRAEGRSGLLSKASEQPIWVDPETGYSRQKVSPLKDGRSNWST